jgi:pimeloyl-ACP methyl ester carboxylesterase
LGFVHNRISQPFAIGQVEPILFGEKWLKDPAHKALQTYWHQQFLSNDKHGFGQTLSSILNRDDFVRELLDLDLPILIISGEVDAASDPAQSERMHAELPHSRLVKIPDVGHTPPVEAPETVNSAMMDFLVSLPSAVESSVMVD